MIGQSKDVTEIKKPKMILFNYGQTLVNEQCFDGVKETSVSSGSSELYVYKIFI